MPDASDFRAALDTIFQDAQHNRLSYIIIKAGALHRQAGGYPGTNHRMPTCCEVMRQNMQAGDVMLYQPPKGNGASLEIQYKLPR